MANPFTSDDSIDKVDASSSIVIPKTMNGLGSFHQLAFEGPNMPPVRAQKVLVPVVADVPFVTFKGSGGERLAREITPADWNQSQARAAATYAAGLTDFIYIGLKGRGYRGEVMKKRFLVNPDTLSVNYDVRDGESQTRGGWQIGIWGEMGQVSLSGWTAGRYFAGCLVDTWSDYSASHQNLQDLILVYENNGVFYEGEEIGGYETPLLASRKQARSHADVILCFGNFMWDGYFTDLKVEDSVEHPYASKFTLGFQILRERYAATSPWRGSVTLDGPNEVRYRGHAWELYGPAVANEVSRRAAETSASALQQGIMSARLAEASKLRQDFLDREDAAFNDPTLGLR